MWHDHPEIKMSGSVAAWVGQKQFTFDAGLADPDLTGKAFSVVIYMSIAKDENMTGFSGAACGLTFVELGHGVDPWRVLV